MEQLLKTLNQIDEKVIKGESATLFISESDCSVIKSLGSALLELNQKLLDIQKEQKNIKKIITLK